MLRTTFAEPATDIGNGLRTDARLPASVDRAGWEACPDG
jgi:hypothetical protein